MLRNWFKVTQLIGTHSGNRHMGLSCVKREPLWMLVHFPSPSHTLSCHRELPLHGGEAPNPPLHISPRISCKVSGNLARQPQASARAGSLHCEALYRKPQLAAPSPAWEQINIGIPNTGKEGNWKHSLYLASPLKYCTMLPTSINGKQGCAERLWFGNALTHVKHVCTGTGL